MKEKYVVSYDLAVKLKELKVKQESCFYWRKESLNGKFLVDINTVKNEISAFMTDELLELLPGDFRDSDWYFLNINKVDDGYNDKKSLFDVEYITRGLCKERIQEDKLPDALAKILIWCIANGFVKRDIFTNKKIEKHKIGEQILSDEEIGYLKDALNTKSDLY